MIELFAARAVKLLAAKVQTPAAKGAAAKPSKATS
jgi:hypothetical protein